MFTVTVTCPYCGEVFETDKSEYYCPNCDNYGDDGLDEWDIEPCCSAEY